MDSGAVMKGISKIYTTGYASPVGELVLAAADDALAGLWIRGQKYFPENMGGLFQAAAEAGTKKEPAVLRQAVVWLDRYFAGERPGHEELRLAPGALAPHSDFRLQVWSLLLEIPYGEVITYRELARGIARQRGLSGMSAQAVGGAVGHNPISIIIPCHRVVGTDGKLTGYAGGLEKKLQLLRLEGARDYENGHM